MYLLSIAAASAQTIQFEIDLTKSTRITFEAWERQPWTEKAIEHVASVMAIQL